MIQDIYVGGKWISKGTQDFSTISYNYMPIHNYFKIKSLNNQQKSNKEPWRATEQEGDLIRMAFCKDLKQRGETEMMQMRDGAGLAPPRSSGGGGNTEKRKCLGGLWCLATGVRARGRAVKLMKAQRTMSRFSALCVASWESEVLSLPWSSVMSWTKWEDEVA